MDKKLRIATFIVLLFLSILLLAMGRKPNMPKYDWLCDESAFIDYPMRIINGNLILENGAMVSIPYGKSFNNGWGDGYSIELIGEKFKLLPVKFDITWFSFTEDKFFHGEFNLPFDKISTMFKNGIESPRYGKPITYHYITVGVAPEGEISIWLNAEGVTQEVANFKAQEANVPWKRLLNNDNISRSEYIKRVLGRTLKKEQLDELEKNGIPKNLSATYRKQYSWDFKVTGVSPILLWLQTYNGECEYINFAKGTDRLTRSVPKIVDLDWQDKWGNKYNTKITMNETEIFQAYNKIFSKTSDSNIKLLLEISDKTGEVVVSLTDSKHLLKLEKCTAQLFSL